MKYASKQFASLAALRALAAVLAFAVSTPT